MSHTARIEFYDCGLAGKPVGFGVEWPGASDRAARKRPYPSRVVLAVIGVSQSAVANFNHQSTDHLRQQAVGNYADMNESVLNHRHPT